MRREPTYAEAKLWKALRKLEVAGSHFRRQVPLGPYVADFACHGAKLIVEVDGGIHRLRKAEDTARDAWLSQRGWRILRFNNNEVGDALAIVDRIEQRL